MKLIQLVLIGALAAASPVLADKGGTPNHGKSAHKAFGKASDVACDHIDPLSHAFEVACLPPPPPCPPLPPFPPGCEPPPPPPPPGTPTK